MHFRTQKGAGDRRGGGHVGISMQPLESRLLCALDNYGTVLADGNDITFDVFQQVHRVWRDASTGRLYYAKRTNNAWGPESQVDTRKAGGEMSIAIDSLHRPSVAYRDFINGDLMIATLINGNWIRTNIDSTNDVGDHPTLRFGPNGRPYITYYDRTNGDLKLAWQSTSGTWVNTQLETSGDVGAFNSLLIEETTGLLRVAYTDATGMRLKYAQQQADGTWFIRAIDRGTPAGVRFASMVFDTRGKPWIAYYDVRKKDLRVSTTADGISWSSQRVASGGAQGEFANMYASSDGSINVMYLNRSLKTVNVATFKGTGWQYTVLAMGAENIATAVSSAGQFIFSATSVYDGKLRTLTTSHDHVYKNAMDPGERILQWETIGHSSTNPAVNYIGWSIPQLGWQQYVDNRIGYLRSLGLKRIFLHNPFGDMNTSHFQFDQYIHAQEAGLTMVTNTFVSAWKPLIDTGFEVIAYIGSLINDTQFTDLTDFDHYMDRVKRSIEPLLEAGASIGLDSIVAAQADSREWKVVAALRNSGVRIYAENRPPRTYAHWHDVNGLYYNTGYIGSNPDINPELHWAAPNHLLRGEILRGTPDPPPGYTLLDFGWRLPQVLETLRDGHTSVTHIERLAVEGYSLPAVMALAFPSGRPGGDPGPRESSVTDQPRFSNLRIIDRLDSLQ